MKGPGWDFVELHGRSAFSFLTGASGPEAVVGRVAELGGGGGGGRGCGWDLRVGAGASGAPPY